MIYVASYPVQAQVQSTKYLGVVIDQHLTWQCHIKCTYTGLYRLKPLSNSLLATLYFGYMYQLW